MGFVQHFTPFQTRGTRISCACESLIGIRSRLHNPERAILERLVSRLPCDSLPALSSRWGIFLWKAKVPGIRRVFRQVSPGRTDM